MLHLLCTLQTAGVRFAERRRQTDEGQTAAEYLGVIVVIAAIVAILVQSQIGNALQTAIVGAIQKIASAG